MGRSELEFRGILENECLRLLSCVDVYVWLHFFLVEGSMTFTTVKQALSVSWVWWCTPIIPALGR